MPKRISIISPVYNEADTDNIRVCYEEIRKLFDGPLAGYEREHIFADNASTDRTADHLRELSARDACVRVIINSRNVGPLRSTFNALKASRGDATIVMMAVDLQDPPELIAEFVRHWERGHKIVQGVRIKRDEGIVLHAARRIFYRAVKAFADLDIPVDVGEFQLIDRQILDALKGFDDHYPYIRGLIAYCGFKPMSVEYTWRARRRGLSKNRLLHLIDIALNGLLTFTKAPVRILTLSGLAISVASIIYAIANLLWVLMVARDTPAGIPTLIVALFFFSGVQLFFLGVIGEYVISIHNQVRFGGRVIEAERINFDEASSIAAANKVALRADGKNG